MKKNNNEKVHIEFTKLLVGGIMISYYVGIIYSMVFIKQLLIVSPDMAVSAYHAWLIFMGAPIPTVVVLYCWKSKCENIPKIISGWVNSSKDPQIKSIMVDALKSGDISKLDPMNLPISQALDQLTPDESQYKENTALQGIQDNLAATTAAIAATASADIAATTSTDAATESTDTSQDSEMASESQYDLNNILNKYAGCK